MRRLYETTLIASESLLVQLRKIIVITLDNTWDYFIQESINLKKNWWPSVTAQLKFDYYVAVSVGRRQGNRDVKNTSYLRH